MNVELIRFTFTFNMSLFALLKILKARIDILFSLLYYCKLETYRMVYHSYKNKNYATTVLDASASIPRAPFFAFSS